MNNILSKYLNKSLIDGLILNGNDNNNNEKNVNVI